MKTILMPSALLLPFVCAQGAGATADEVQGLSVAQARFNLPDTHFLSASE
jgi:hypothetical protein